MFIYENILEKLGKFWVVEDMFILKFKMCW